MTENYQRKNYYKKNQSQSLAHQSSDIFEGSAVRDLEEWKPSYQPDENNEEDRGKKRKPINFNRIFTMLSIFIIVTCSFANLYVRWQVSQANRRIQNIQLEETDLINETQMLMIEKAENLKYENIESVAKANGMKTEMDRVKDIDQNEE